MSTKYTDQQYAEALVAMFRDGGFDENDFDVDDTPVVSNGDGDGAYVGIWYWMSDQQMEDMGYPEQHQKREDGKDAAPSSRRPEDGTWRESAETPGLFRLDVPVECGGPGLTLFGTFLHVEAIEITYTNDGEQRVAHEHNADTFDLLFALREAVMLLATIKIDGRDCILYTVPSER
jgi:hypothetical protein